jgi:hypothetical protein
MSEIVIHDVHINATFLPAKFFQYFKFTAEKLALTQIQSIKRLTDDQFFDNKLIAHLHQLFNIENLLKFLQHTTNTTLLHILNIDKLHTYSSPLIISASIQNYDRDLFMKFNFEQIHPDYTVEEAQNIVEQVSTNDSSKNTTADFSEKDLKKKKVLNKSECEQYIYYALLPIFLSTYGSNVVYLTSFKNILKKYDFQNCIELYDNKIDNYNNLMVNVWMCNNKNNFLKYTQHDILYINCFLKDDMTLADYLTNINIFTYKIIREVKIILLMILNTLVIIQKYYPLFRHNDLHTGNITMRLINEEIERKFTMIKIPSENVHHKIGDFVVNIIDFNRAEIPELGIYNKNIRNFNYEYIFDDIFMLLHSVYISTRNHNNVYLLDNILAEIDPTKSYIFYDAKYTMLKYGKKPTNQDLLKSSAWDDIKIQPAD